MILLGVATYFGINSLIILAAIWVDHEERKRGIIPKDPVTFESGVVAFFIALPTLFFC